MPALLSWMLGVEQGRALLITAGGTGYWAPTATEDLDRLVVMPTEFLGFDPVSKREIEVLWVRPGTAGG